MTQYKVKNTLIQMGKHLKIARIQRKLSTKDMAARLGISLDTLYRLERGDPGIKLELFISTLCVLGLEETFMKLLDPTNDSLGFQNALKNLPKRIDKPRKKQQKQNLDEDANIVSVDDEGSAF